MKTAQTDKGSKVIASANAPATAICPHCRGTVALRSRKQMGKDEKTYYWRHQANQNRGCKRRTGPL